MSNRLLDLNDEQRQAVEFVVESYATLKGAKACSSGLGYYIYYPKKDENGKRKPSENVVLTPALFLELLEEVEDEDKFFTEVFKLDSTLVYSNPTEFYKRCFSVDMKDASQAFFNIHKKVIK